MRSPYQVLLKPRITEKGSRMATSTPTVVFEVPLDADKIEVRRAVEEAFNVEVVDVRTMIVRGKLKRRGRFVGKRPNFKKAIITLAEGNEIDFFGTTA
jgi:large subunit ribosomal protein L23